MKELAVCSDEKRYANINKTRRIKQLEKKKRRLQREIARKYKKGGSYCKISNLIKSEEKLLRINHRLANIRQNYVLQVHFQDENRYEEVGMKHKSYNFL